MPIHWNAQLAVGVEDIDQQHRELFGRINALLAALSEHQGKDELDGLVTYLQAYVDEHFRAEERLMKTSGFPERVAHCGEHAVFEKECVALAAALREEGPASHLAVRASRILVDWLRQHVLTRDRALGAYLTGSRRTVA
ncbi:MAG: bacteriohemerythrin [Anaeromyxobacter sp.]